MKSQAQRALYDFKIGGHRIFLGSQTKIMGVLNVTPDSFSDGGRHFALENACAAAIRMQNEGADFVDIGGESSRPGAKPVSAREETRRVVPVVRRLAKKIQIPISVDTTKYDVGSAALDHGAVLINDISGLKGNARLAKKIARCDAGVVLMHMRGTPRTMQSLTDYKDLLKEVTAFLKTAVQRALDAGIRPDAIAVDPGFGFAKTYEQNLRMLAELSYFQILKKPVLVGLSRKSFIGQTLGAPVEGRLVGSLAAAAAAVVKGAHILRVHDVAPHREMTKIMDDAFRPVIA